MNEPIEIEYPESFAESMIEEVGNDYSAIEEKIAEIARDEALKTIIEGQIAEITRDEALKTIQGS